MMINFLGWVARRRVAVLVVSLLAAVALQVVRHDYSPWVTAVPAFAFILCMAVAARVFHPARLVARPEVPALDVPANPGAVLGAAAYTFVVVPILGVAFRDNQEAVDYWFAAAAVVILGGQLAAFWWPALGRFGVRLTPDGITDRQVYSRLFVPWAALATPESAVARGAHQVVLRYARPDLVRKRGFRIDGRATLSAAGIDAALLARTINAYSNDPAARSAIGSEGPTPAVRCKPSGWS